MIVRHNAGSESTKPYKTESESMAMVGICWQLRAVVKAPPNNPDDIRHAISTAGMSTSPS